MSQLLKKLELAGFKSFADKTTLEFPAGITAIVGPNGSGKSNVIDAIRWLLGEREARNLRGGKVGDLIFAGTPKRARVGLAQASLYFENRNNFFPIDFEEITVTRQISRDGANKYFINKSEVRLKDLVDFFAQARLGSRGMTVVTQGNSDVFIRASTKERREMIEEVLGLKEYQLKKAGAERHLLHTVENLEKASALIHEIAPHMRSLKRQTSRWEKREELTLELRVIENELFGNAWRELRAQSSAINTVIKDHEKKHDALLKEKEEAEMHIREVEGGEPKERKELNAIRDRVKMLLEMQNRTQKELGRIEAKIELSQERDVSVPFIDIKKIRENLRLVHDLLEQSLSEARDVSKELVLEALQYIETILEEKELYPKKGDGDVSEDLMHDLRTLEKSFKEFGEEIHELRTKEKELEHTQEDFHSDFKKALARLDVARNSLQQWERIFQEKNIDRERITMRKEELERHITQAGRSISEFETAPEEERRSGETRDILERRMLRLRGELAAMGEVDEAIIREAREIEERYAFLERESKDLRDAQHTLRTLVSDLDKKIATEFSSALKKINQEFQKFFDIMFGGGAARLVSERQERTKHKELTLEYAESGQSDKGKKNSADDNGNNEELGIEIKLSLPRKRLTSLEVLSGGERSLVGIATLFALISVSPPPFLVLDEIDAALDDRNARRFAEMLKEFAKETQFVVVTHNRATMEVANVLYGVTLGEDGASKILSMKLE